MSIHVSTETNSSAQWSEVDVSQFQWGFCLKKINNNWKVCVCVHQKWEEKNMKNKIKKKNTPTTDWPFNCLATSSVGNSIWTRNIYI